MSRLGLTLNESKTAIRDARRETFDFLGYSFGPHRYRKDGHWYLGASPSKTSVQRLKTKVSELLVPGNIGAGRMCVIGSIDCYGAGAHISATAPGCRRIGRSTTTSMTGSGTSWFGVTRCRRAALIASPRRRCSARLESCGSGVSILAPRRVPRSEASRKAGCGKSARPV